MKKKRKSESKLGQRMKFIYSDMDKRGRKMLGLLPQTAELSERRTAAAKRRARSQKKGPGLNPLAYLFPGLFRKLQA